MPDRDGPPRVLFLPGFMQPADAWAPVARALGQRYPSRGIDLEARTFVEALAELGRRVPDGAVLAGYSFGGRLALHAVVHGYATPSALVLIGVSGGIEDPAARAARRASDEKLAAWMEERPIEEVVAFWERLPVFASQTPELVAAQRPGRLASDPRRLASLLRSGGQGALEPVWHLLPQVDCPVLALAGADDRPYAEAAERIARLVPRGEARFVPGAGHAPQLERPAVVADRLAEFLDAHLGEGALVDVDAEPGSGRHA